MRVSKGAPAAIALAAMAIVACREPPLPDARTTLPPPTQEQRAALHRPLRIVAIGDSITQGRRGGPGVAAVVSWRHPFQRFVRRAGFEVDMVGTSHGGLGGDPPWPSIDGEPFDPDHEAAWNLTLHAAIARLDRRIGSLEPDIALVHLGDTDVGDGASIDGVIADHRRLVAMLRRHRPTIAIVLATDCSDFDDFPEFRRRLRAASSSMSTARSPVVVADGCAGWISDPDDPQTSTVDWVHPNARGDEAIARAFFDAIASWLAH